MGSDANKLRVKWQDYAGTNAENAEKKFHEVFDILFKDMEYMMV